MTIKGSFDYNNDHEFTLKEIDKRCPSDKAGYEKFLGTTKAIFDKGFTELADQPFLNFTDMLKVVPDLIKLQSYKNVYNYMASLLKMIFFECVFLFILY